MNGIFTSLCRTHLNIQIGAEAVKNLFSFIGSMNKIPVQEAYKYLLDFFLTALR